MICSVCNKRQATTHIKRVADGVLKEYYLCPECAKEQGYVNSFGASLLESFFRSSQVDDSVVCDKCGTSFDEIRRNKKFGCAECYKKFRRRLGPMIEQIHGTTKHKGKRPGSSALRVQESNNTLVPVEKNELITLKGKLQKAIVSENFEEAAVLRDRIKELENNE